MQADSWQLALEPERPVNVRILETRIVLVELLAHVLKNVLVSFPEINLFFVYVFFHPFKSVLKFRSVNVAEQFFVYLVLDFTTVNHDSEFLLVEVTLVPFFLQVGSHNFVLKAALNTGFHRRDKIVINE